MNEHPIIPYNTIQAATAGDSEAMETVLRHYDRYISACSRRSFYDEYGNRYEFVDQEIKGRVQTKLMWQIVNDFDCTRLPPGETLEE